MAISVSKKCRCAKESFRRPGQSAMSRVEVTAAVARSEEIKETESEKCGKEDAPEHSTTRFSSGCLSARAR